MNFENYINDGRFAKEAIRLGLETRKYESATLPPEAFVTRLPDSARKTLTTLVDMLKTGTFPAMYAFQVNGDSWGFDFAAQGIEVLDDNFEADLSGDVYSLALDGGGNHHCLHANGNVVVWNHEESNIEGNSQFACLDEALFAWMHRAAVGLDSSKYTADVKAIFEAQAESGENGWSVVRNVINEVLEDE